MKRKLKLSSNAAIGGVCAGIAEYFDNDPVLVRIAFCLLFMCFPITMISAYTILSICMSDH